MLSKKGTRGKIDMKAKNILIIDDDIHIGNMLEEMLKLEGYSVSRAYSGTEALLILRDIRPDLVLLDLMLPGLSGEELLPHIKHIPVIVVSAKVDVGDKVKLLLDGAADYVTKPFDVSELLARITVQLRKNEGGQENSVVRARDVILNPELLMVEVSGVEISLTRTECAILRILMQNAGRPIGRNTILDKISMDTPDCTERSLKQHISNIRKKMQAVNGVDYIEAVYGIGFRFIS